MRRPLSSLEHFTRYLALQRLRAKACSTVLPMSEFEELRRQYHALGGGSRRKLRYLFTRIESARQREKERIARLMESLLDALFGKPEGEEKNDRHHQSEAQVWPGRRAHDPLRQLRGENG